MTSTAAKVAVAQLGIGNTGSEVTDWFRQQLLAALSDPLFNVPKAFETWVVDRVAVSGLNIPIGQVIGFRGTQMRAATFIEDADTTTSAYPTFVDLAHVGPSLSGLADGTYMVAFGANVSNSLGGDSAMALNINGVAPTDVTGGLVQSSTQAVTTTRIVTVDLNNGDNNSLKAQYCTAAGTASFHYRWLYALKLANI